MYARTLAAFTAVALIGACIGTPAFAQDAMAGAGRSMSHGAMHKTGMQQDCKAASKDSMQHDSMKQDSMQHDSMKHASMQGTTHRGCAMQKDRMQHQAMHHDGMLQQHDAMEPASSSAMGHGG